MMFIIKLWQLFFKKAYFLCKSIVICKLYKLKYKIKNKNEINGKKVKQCIDISIHNGGYGKLIQTI